MCTDNVGINIWHWMWQCSTQVVLNDEKLINLLLIAHCCTNQLLNFKLFMNHWLKCMCVSFVSITLTPRTVTPRNGIKSAFCWLPNQNVIIAFWKSKGKQTQQICFVFPSFHPLPPPPSSVKHYCNELAWMTRRQCSEEPFPCLH